MGVFKILGFAALGVGAVAAAPFTGGGSLLGAATLAESLAGAGAVAAAAGAVGSVVGMAESDEEEEERRSERKTVHEAAFNGGVKKGTDATKKKFEAILEKENNYRIGIFALGMCVAAKDDDIAAEELEEIERYLGRPDNELNHNIAEELENICDNIPEFYEVKSKYLEQFSNDDLKNLNDFVHAIIEADGIISDKEHDFLVYQWNPYLVSRKILL